MCDRIPHAIGAVLCDQQGESIVSALGRAQVPPLARERAQDHVPSRLDLNIPVGEFLVRLAGAEPCALLRQIQATQNERNAGTLAAYVARYDEVDVVVEQLPDDLYLFVVVRRPSVVGRTRYHTLHACERLRAFLD